MKNIKYIFIIVMLSTVISSCKEDYVDLANPNRNTAGSFWSTQDDAIHATNAIYQTLHYDGCYRRLYNWNMDVRADDVINSSPWWITNVSNFIYNDINDPCYIAPWEHNYIGVWRANQVLENIGNIEVESELKKRLTGEAQFLRGLFYYHLKVSYRRVPLITSLPENADDLYPPLATEQEIWDQIILDFSNAKENLWSKNEGRFTDDNKGRATKGAAAAYLAKVLMMNKRWAEAETELKAIIDGNY